MKIEEQNTDEDQREKDIDEGLACMEYWPRDDGTWQECRELPHEDGGPLCKYHAAMADATIRAGRKGLGRVPGDASAEGMARAWQA